MTNLAQTPQLNIPDVICSPILAKIEHINDLGKSTWYEVVYYDDKWYSYSGSKTTGRYKSDLLWDLSDTDKYVKTRNER